MCGLVGILNGSGDPVDRAALTGMLERISHRGPDGRGMTVEAGIGLGHARLSILDLSRRAAQPMQSQCGRYVMAYNGEIYNFPSLRRRLERAGVRIASTGDTEVLIECLARDGVEQTLPALEGFFAFALWDRQRRRLTLARDRHGIKPLYYAVGSGGDVRFASETKALHQGAARPDPCSLDAVLLGRGDCWGRRTLYQGIERVQPGEVISFDGGAAPSRRRLLEVGDFVDPGLHRQLVELVETKPTAAGRKAVIDRVAEELEQSIRMRLVSDAPIGCLVSGGVDSSLIAAIASRLQPQLPLYHADVAGNSERAAAQRLAEHLGKELRVAAVSAESFLDNLARVTFHNDAPIIYHPSAVPFAMVSRIAAGDGIKALLTGEGSDEYFLGYPLGALQPYLNLYRGALGGIHNLARRCFPRAARLLLPRSGDSRAEMIRRLVFRFEEELVKIDGASALGHLAPGRERDAHVTSLCLLQPHLATLLHRNDRQAMAWGIESRFPFLGRDLARLAFNLPLKAKLRHTWSFHDPRHPFVADKWCIRKVAERYLPRDLAWRPKKGFPISVSERLRVDAAFFHDGFIADWYGLSRRALGHLIAHSTRGWISHLLFAEVWAQLFVLQQSCDDTRRRIHRHVGIRPSVRPAAPARGSAASPLPCPEH